MLASLVAAPVGGNLKASSHLLSPETGSGARYLGFKSKQVEINKGKKVTPRNVVITGYNFNIHFDRTAPDFFQEEYVCWGMVVGE